MDLQQQLVASYSSHGQVAAFVWAILRYLVPVVGDPFMLYPALQYLLDMP